MLNSYNTSRDITLDVTKANGQSLRIREITSFMAKQDVDETRVKRIDGVNDHLKFPTGWSGTIGFDRKDDVVDAFIAEYEEAYYRGVNTLAMEISETIANVDGSISLYRYEGVVMHLSDAGNKEADKTISMKLDWKSSRRRKVR